MTPKRKKWIDEANYHTFMYRWLHSSPKDALFRGDTLEYYHRIMGQKRNVGYLTESTTEMLYPRWISARRAKTVARDESDEKPL